MSKHTPGEGREPTMKLKTNAPLDMLKHHVTGAIQRGEATAIVAQSSKHTPILVELTPRKFVIGPFEAERCPENHALTKRIVECVNALDGMDICEVIMLLDAAKRYRLSASDLEREWNLKYLVNCALEVK